MGNTVTPAHEARIIDLITPAFRSIFADDGLVISRALNARMVPNWDSLNHIALVVGLEQITGTQFTTDELATMPDVGALIDCLASKGVAS
ncbi:MAG: acyl carrier protein [Rhodospirillaceae bacterium]